MVATRLSHGLDVTLLLLGNRTPTEATAGLWGEATVPASAMEEKVVGVDSCSFPESKESSN